MRSILTIMAIEHVAPGVRTVAEVNNPRHEPHFRRADVDELLVTSKVASHLLARSALYPGLTGIVTDIVSGGEGSELYRITLPDEYFGLSIDAVAARLRTEHRATLLSVNRGGHAFVNPAADFILEPDDDASSWPSRWARWRRSRCTTSDRPDRAPRTASVRRAATGRSSRRADARLQRLDRRGQRRQAVLRVGEQHPGLLVRVQLVVDAGVARPIERLMTTIDLAWSTSRIGMPDTGEPGRRAAGFVTSLAPMTSATSARANSGLMSSISLSCGIGHVGLGEEHVHVPRHPAGDRVDRVLHVDAALLEQLGQLAHGVLRLGDGEAVARDDDHVLGVGQLDRDVVGADGADRAARPGRGAGRVVAATEPADHDVQDRPVHGVGHELGQDRARRADEGAGDDQHRVVDHEARPSPRPCR